MSDKKSSSPLLVGGLPGSGKTSLICGLLSLGKKNKLNLAGFKPFDQVKTAIDAKDELSDGEIFCRLMSSNPLLNLVAPYHAYENYPIEMANRRDGIKIDWRFLKERISLLAKLYDQTLMETPSGLYTPITEDKLAIEWLGEISRKILWIISPEQSQFEANLAQIWSLKHFGFEMVLILNNRKKNPDQDLLFYIWEKIEKFANQQIEGMIPFCEINNFNFANLVSGIEENLPGLMGELIPNIQE